jgi:acyl-CoA synthetase (AMP-forming)/AMP-acid ligase II
VYTSGTTADPKGVQHTHNTLLAEIRAHPAVPARGPEVSLAVFPAGHIGGVLGLTRLFARGTMSVLMDTWDADDAAALIAEHRVTSTAGTPFHLMHLLDAADRGGHDITSLRSYMVGAASVPPSLVERAAQHGLAAFRAYGSSEHPTVTSGSAGDPLDVRARTDGRLTPGNEIRIVDDDGHDLACGVDGEVVTRGPEQFVGYRDPALDDASFLPGRWFRTGDIGHVDGDSYLTITDRKKDIIIRGGENISSKEVEDILAAHPSVAEAAAVGSPDPTYGERVAAFVILRPGAHLDLDAVREHFTARGVARQKTPERIEIVEDLPRTAAGKVKKFELRTRLRDH